MSIFVKYSPIGLVLAAVALPLIAVRAADKPAAAAIAHVKQTLWSDPADAATRDLFYGIGGKENVPQAPFTFKEEDMNGTNPKFDVTDAGGVKWKVKLGNEARPETAASRFVWAAGYFVPEDYHLADIHVSGMPTNLRRGEKLIVREGENGAEVRNVRLKREAKGEKKIGDWSWKDDPFKGTREWNGLRILMALVNNWDLKDVNNSIYQTNSENIYMVTDLGASFASDGRSYPESRAKDDLDNYAKSVFIKHIGADSVDFAVPARPRFIYFVSPIEYIRRVHLEWIGKQIPREDARWLGQILARLSPDQIHDAFRAAGYSPADIDSFSKIVLQRIGQLTAL